MGDICELCNAREAIQWANVDDVETLVCSYCAAMPQEFVNGVWQLTVPNGAW